jgi:hypothetical protein
MWESRVSRYGWGRNKLPRPLLQEIECLVIRNEPYPKIPFLADVA